MMTSFDQFATQLSNAATIAKRCQAAHALARLNDPRVIEVLANHLSTTDIELYGCLTSALSWLNVPQATDILIQQVWQQDDCRRNIATNKLIRLGSAAVPALLTAYHNATGTVRAFFLKALGRINDPAALPVFIAALNDDTFDVFWVAAAIQRQRQDPDAVPHLIQALNHDRRQRIALRTLSCFHDQRVYQRFITLALDRQAAPSVRDEAIAAVGQLGQARAVGLLQEWLQTEHNPHLRQAILVGLSLTGSPEAVPIIGRAADQHPDHVTYHTLIGNLFHTGDQATQNAFALFLEQNEALDQRVRQTIIHHLSIDLGPS